VHSFPAGIFQRLKAKGKGHKAMEGRLNLMSIKEFGARKRQRLLTNKKWLLFFLTVFNPSCIKTDLFSYSIGKDVIPMVCTSVKEGVDCHFMSNEGCQFNGGTCHEIIEQCEGCQKAQVFPTGSYCLVFPDPAAKWRLGKCNMATHMKETAKKEAAKVNPLKASKRKMH
jgi:hypothetical protein